MLHQEWKRRRPLESRWKQRLVQVVRTVPLDVVFIDACEINIAEKFRIMPDEQQLIAKVFYKAGYDYRFGLEFLTDNEILPTYSFDPEFPYYTEGKTAVAFLTITPPNLSENTEYPMRIYLGKRMQ